MSVHVDDDIRADSRADSRLRAGSEDASRRAASAVSKGPSDGTNYNAGPVDNPKSVLGDTFLDRSFSKVGPIGESHNN